MAWSTICIATRSCLPSALRLLHQDIVIPGLENEKSLTTGKNRGAPGSARDVFAFFRGTIHNKGGASYSRGIRIKMQAALEVCATCACAA